MFERLLAIYMSCDFPVVGHDEDGNFVEIRRGKRDGQCYFKCMTYQDNGWVRVNIYWEDGTREELYQRKG